MPNIHDYLDFRKFLEDYYNEKKNVNPRFSYKTFSDKIGFKAKDFIYRVIHKKGKLSQNSVFLVCKALGLNAEESRYFMMLVHSGQAETQQEKEFFLEQLQSDFPLKNKKRTTRFKLAEQHLDLFSDWYFLAIHAIIDIQGFSGDYLELSKLTRPSISPLEAKKAVAGLLQMGLIAKNAQSKYSVTQKSIETEPEIASLSLARFYQSCTVLASKAISELPRAERHSSGVTMGISYSTYTQITEWIHEFRQKIVDIVDEDKSPEEVYQLHMNLFPLSNIKHGKEPKV